MAGIKIIRVRGSEILLNLSPLLMFLCRDYTLATLCQQIMNTGPTIPRIIFTTYIPTISELSLLR